MNKGFHYLAVKYLARRAGISEKDSQTIAEYSQFVNDCKKEYKVNTDIQKLPQDIKDYELWHNKSNECWVNIPKTNALSNDDVPDRQEWENDLNDKRTQLFALMPFHYMPRAQITEEDLGDYYEDRWDYYESIENEAVTCWAISNPEKHALFGLLQNLAAEQFQLREGLAFTEGLIRTGVLCHILADSFSHDQFSGCLNQTNQVKVMDIQKCEDKAKLGIGNYNLDAPRVGHAQVKSAPDDNAVMGNLLRDDAYGYNFNNEQNLKNAAEQVFRLFLSIQGKTLGAAEKTCMKESIEKLHNLLDYNSNDSLLNFRGMCSDWKKSTSYDYEYSADNIRARLVSGIDELCRYIIVVYDIKRTVCDRAVLNLNFS